MKNVAGDNIAEFTNRYQKIFSTNIKTKEQLEKINEIQSSFREAIVDSATTTQNVDPLIPVTIITPEPVRQEQPTLHNISIKNINGAATFQGSIKVLTIHDLPHNGCAMIKVTQGSRMAQEASEVNKKGRGNILSKILPSKKVTISATAKTASAATKTKFDLSNNFSSIINTPISEGQLTFVIKGKSVDKINDKVLKAAKSTKSAIFPVAHQNPNITYNDLYKELNSGAYDLTAKWVLQERSDLYLVVTRQDGTSFQANDLQIQNKDKNAGSVITYDQASFDRPIRIASANSTKAKQVLNSKARPAINITLDKEGNNKTGGRYSAKDGEGSFIIDLKNGNSLHFRVPTPTATIVQDGDTTHEVYISNRDKNMTIDVKLDHHIAKKGILDTIEFINQGLNLDKHHRESLHTKDASIMVHSPEVQELGKYGFSYDLAKGIILDNENTLSSALDSNLPSVLGFFRSLRQSVLEQGNDLMKAADTTKTKLALESNQNQAILEEYLSRLSFANSFTQEVRPDLEASFSPEVKDLLKPELVEQKRTIQFSEIINDPSTAQDTNREFPNSIQIASQEQELPSFSNIIAETPKGGLSSSNINHVRGTQVREDPISLDLSQPDNRESSLVKMTSPQVSPIPKNNQVFHSPANNKEDDNFLMLGRSVSSPVLGFEKSTPSGSTHLPPHSILNARRNLLNEVASSPDTQKSAIQDKEASDPSPFITKQEVQKLITDSVPELIDNSIKKANLNKSSFAESKVNDSAFNHFQDNFTSGLKDLKDVIAGIFDILKRLSDQLKWLSTTSTLANQKADRVFREVFPDRFPNLSPSPYYSRPDDLETSMTKSAKPFNASGVWQTKRNLVKVQA